MKCKRMLCMLLTVRMAMSLFACTSAPHEDDGVIDNETPIVETDPATEAETEAATEPTTESVTEEETETETEPATEAALETAPPIVVADNNQVFNGFFCATNGKVDAEKLDYVNCALLGPGNQAEFKMELEKSVEEGNYFWVYTTFLQGGVRNGSMTLVMMWEKHMERIVKQIKEADAYDLFLGWYMDEPLLNKFTPEQVYEVSKYNAETYGKRYFICFAVEGFAPHVYSDGIVKKHMTREFSTYITDAAYDMYWEYGPNRNTYEKINEALHEAMPEDCRIWYVPWTYVRADNKTAKQADKYELRLIAHLNAMYEFLKAEENPGGLVSFLWQGKGFGYWGVDEMVAEGYWLKLHKRLEEIGTEIVSGALNKE